MHLPVHSAFLLTFVLPSGFPLEFLDSSETGIYPKVFLEIFKKRKYFCETWLVL